MSDEELLSIGRFARLAGLSIGALRHYHELGLLLPSRVDPETAYRSYAHAQLGEARLIVRLRELELPLPEVRATLGADAVERRRLLAAHRSRLTALLARTQRQVHWLNQAIDHEEPLMTAPSAPVDVADRRQLAVDLFNHVWTLLERTDRAPLQDDEMLHAAHASRYHWGEVGEPVNLARGEWQCSRVYAVLGRSEPALWHARRCVAIYEANGIAGWDIASGYEAMARAYLTAGNLTEVAVWKAKAQAALDLVDDPDDREVIEGDLATLQ